MNVIKSHLLARGPTHLPSYMGPYFVAGLQGVPSEAE